jgi:hypothetical protein
MTTKHEDGPECMTWTPEQIKAYSAKRKAEMTADELAELINMMDGPTISSEQFFAELEKEFPGHFTWATTKGAG